MRLDKFLCEMKMGTRSQVKELVKQGRVSINGQTEVRSERQVDIQQDEITCRGQVLVYEQFEYFMLHKPAGVVSATRDARERTVLDLLSARKDLFPVGRLDKDTEGLVLLTNNGKLAHQLLSPKKQIPKTYYARLEQTLSEEKIEILEQGTDIGDAKPTLPARVTKLSEREIYLTITEGRFHQVKRMLEAVGNRVEYLKRISIGPLLLDESLDKGQYRRLKEAELREINDYI